MTLDALRLEVPDILNEEASSLADLNERLAAARLSSAAAHGTAPSTP